MFLVPYRQAEITSPHSPDVVAERLRTADFRTPAMVSLVGRSRLRFHRLRFGHRVSAYAGYQRTQHLSAVARRTSFSASRRHHDSASGDVPSHSDRCDYRILHIPCRSRHEIQRREGVVRHIASVSSFSLRHVLHRVFARGSQSGGAHSRANGLTNRWSQPLAGVLKG